MPFAPRKLLLAVPLLIITQCSPGSDVDVTDTDASRLPELYVPIDSYDFSRNPKLLERIVASPYQYFRFINKRFAKTICEKFEQELPGMPTVNLHGDPHIEQYSVTESGRGLTDFDDASTGPAALDIFRFGVSIQLAVEERGWFDKKSALVEEFLRGYRKALEDPETTAPEPQIVARVRASFDSDRRSLLAWADSLMTPEPVSELPGQVAIDLFSEVIHDENPDLPPHYFDVVKAGRLRMGVGSALDQKYLARVQGPTLESDDDVLVEIKEVRDLSGIDCIHRRAKDPFAILAAQSRIAYTPYKFTGFIYLDPRRTGDHGLDSDFWDGSSFWVHTWVDHYWEVSINDLASPEELAEIVYDVGVQLGRGHPKAVASPHDFQLRKALLGVLDEYEPDIDRRLVELTVGVNQGWQQFRAAAATAER